MSGAITRGPAVRPLPRPWVAILLTGLAMIGVDFALHAGLLAPLYDWASPFLLRPADAVVRIPIGYLSLLVLAATLAWVLPRCDITTARQGAALAGGFGAVVWGALLLGLWSISTADPRLLLGWWAAQTIELGVGGLVIGSLLGGVAVRTVARRVAALIVVGAVSAVVLQTIGYATAPTLVH